MAPMRALKPLGAALLLAAALTGAAAASPFDEDRLREMDPPTPLPEGYRTVVRPQREAPRIERVERLSDISRALRACWLRPMGSGLTGQEITVRLSFKRNGELLGEPRITYYKAGGTPEQREELVRSVREMLARCLPLPFTEGLGHAVAGRPIILRFIDSQPI